MKEVKDMVSGRVPQLVCFRIRSIINEYTRNRAMKYLGIVSSNK